MGQMIKEVQEWINETYGGKDDFQSIPVTGETGWTTTNALLIGLQIELGISPSTIESELSNEIYTFGDETKELCPEIYYGLDLNTNKLKNISIILQSGFWCKGIAPGPYGSLTGELTSDITNAIKTLQGWAGIEQTGIATYLEFKALLSMDTFRIIDGGDPNVRAVQQSINGKYATDMQELIPCDGLVTRQLQSAFLFVLEMLDGFPAEACRYALQPENFGYFAPNLLEVTPAINVGDVNGFVSLLQHVLYCSGYNILFTGIYDQQTADAVLAFKLTMMLGETTEITGAIWESLLTSHGYSGRPAKGCDTSTTLTLETAQNLKAEGYEIVGRYLTDRFKMTVEELENIFKAGLRVFPIFETYGTYASYFTAQQGTIDAYAAFEAAKELGIPGETIIYFGVDCDILDGDVSSTVIPYFQGISNQFRLNGSPYKIGVYGSRNICNKTKIAGLTEGSFVSDMSAGYSGNIMNFQMPKDWAFDQFATVKVGGVAIDKDAYSGVDTGFGSINPPVEQPTGENVGCDTGYVISSEEAIAIANNGYKIVGRTINGENALTLNEIANIEAAGLSIVPIYVSRMNINEDVFWNKQQGTYDAVDAINIAKSLNIPSGTTIYFTANYYNTQAALDYVVNPYFSGVKAQFTVDNVEYQIGIYGPRNACLAAEANGTAVLSFVEGAKNIRYGNEGYEMPSNWAFNQYGAGEVNGLGINKDTVSGKDNGFGGNESIDQELLNEFNKIFNTEVGMSVFKEPIELCDISAFNISLEATIAVNPNGNNEIVVNQDGTMTFSRSVGNVIFDPSFLIQGLNRFAAQSMLQSLSVKLYQDGKNKIYFGVSNINPFTVKFDIYLEKYGVQVDFTITVTLGEDNGERPTNLPNAELVSYFTGLAGVVGGAYIADTNNGLVYTKEVLASITAVASVFKVIKGIGEEIGGLFEWVETVVPQYL